MALTRRHVERIDALFSNWTADAPGGLVALIERGEVVHLRYRGLANLEHGVTVAEETRYPIRSITKTFTGAACALLHHEGRLDLGADVRRYVPELRPESPVTVRHLLNMTSGLRDSIDAMVLRGIVVHDAVTIRLDKMGVGLTLRPAGDGTFVDTWANFRSTLRMEADGALLLDFGGDTGRYERIGAPVAVGGDVTGLYHCADLRSDAEVFARDGKLMLRFGLAFRREAEVVLEPLAPDMFFARYLRPWANHMFAVRFVRHSHGVVRMVVSSALLKDTVFVRM